MSSFDTVVFDDTSIGKIQAFKTLYTQLEKSVLTLEDSREKLYAITNLEQSFMWLTRLIEREQVSRSTAVLAQQMKQQAQVQSPPPVAQPAKPYAPKSADAAVLAEGTAKMEELQRQLQNLMSGVLPTN
jgi:hypothetical protein